MPACATILRPLFRTIGRGTVNLYRTPLPQANAWEMIERRRTAADIEIKIGNHNLRGTGITAYLKNGGTLEKAASMADHASTRTTQLYDRRLDDVSLNEVELDKDLNSIFTTTTAHNALRRLGCKKRETIAISGWKRRRSRDCGQAGDLEWRSPMD